MIVKLPEEVVSRIAAGEVVERPASVVKELVENSIDAGATRIDVEVVKAGRVLIKVVDNGIGMNSQDAVLAFERHATSKIKEEEDLYRIESFGFRGEALPSIASVAKVVLRTRAEGEEIGTEVRVEGGRITEVKPCYSPPGTAVEVRELFYNTPARRKFLRSDSWELAQIREVVNRYLLAFPEVEFRLKLGSNKEVFKPACLLDRAAKLLKVKPEDVVEIHQENLKAVISKPGHSLPYKAEYFFVNRRFIRSKIFSQALKQAYSTLVPKGRHPLAVVFLDIPPEEVDVNVHPQKIEARFKDEAGVLSNLVKALQSALTMKSEHKPLSSFKTLPIEDMHKPVVMEKSAEYKTAKKDVRENILSEAKPMAQLFNTYIVAEHPRGLVIVDQHAAHERILYEEFEAELSRGGVKKQKLLNPRVVELPPREKSFLLENIEFIEAMGFEIEDFGGDSVIVRAVPVFLGEVEGVEELIAGISSLHTLPLRERRKEMIYRVACSRAVKAGDFLLQEEMEALLRKLSRMRHPEVCPHGRPTYIVIEKRELERKFRR